MDGRSGTYLKLSPEGFAREQSASNVLRRGFEIRL